MAELVIDAARLKEARAKQAYSQRDLAHRAGLRETTVYHVESGRRARPSTIRKIADALGVQPTDIADLR